MKNKIYRIVKRLLKPLLEFAKKVHTKYQNVIVKRSYNTWATENERLCFVGEIEPEKKLVSVVVPVFNAPKEHLREMVYSVVNQHYQNWELILVNASSDSELKKYATELTSVDKRVLIVAPESNLGISANTNFGLKYAKGEFIAFLDHDDIIHPCALHSIMKVQAHDDADVIYTDEDKINDEGNFYFNPLCKPEWSPHLLENVNYINHFTIIRRSLLEGIGGLRIECDGAQDYDLLLRATDNVSTVVSNVPKVLYHWRAAISSTASDISTKKYIFKAGKKALDDHFERKKIQATATVIEGRPGFYRTTYAKVKNISVVVGDVDKRLQPASANWISDLLKKQDTGSVEVVVGDWFRPYMNKIKDGNITLVNSKTDYLSSAIKASKFTSIILFNDIATPRNNEYLFELSSVAKFSGAEIVQPVILGSDNTIIDAGLVGSDYGHQPLFKGKKYMESTFFGSTEWVRDIGVVSGSVVAAEKNKLLEYVSHKDKTKQTHVLWSHTMFEWQSILRQRQTPRYFNPQLSESMYDISFYKSVWDEQRDRVNE